MLPTLAEWERTYFEAVLAFHEGDKAKTAVTLGVSLKTIYNKLERYQADDAKREETES